MNPPDWEDDVQKFGLQMSRYEHWSLGRINQHFQEDLICILEDLDPHVLWRELDSREVLKVEGCPPIKIEASEILQQILEKGRKAVIGLWKCLHALKNLHPHPNLLAVLGEIDKRGECLVEEILLDEHGHTLRELTDIQKEHKQHLMEKTQNLVEHKPPGTTLEPQAFLINERYVNLIVVSTHQFRQRPQNELIQTGVKHEECLREAKTGLEHISPNRLFRWSHQSGCVPHAVMVSGVPGIGKTTLVQKFVFDWVNGKLYQRFAFVFFFRFRDLNRLGEVSLEEMILQQYLYLQIQIENILQHPERLLFIFDGLDESIHQMDFRLSKRLDPKQKRDLGEIVVSLVRQSLLKGCSILITSRPTRLASIDTDVFQRMAEIMGFLHRDRFIYFEHFFNNSELSARAFHYVQENDTLYTFCYIPSYCWIICTVLSMCFRAQPTNNRQLMASLPTTVTQLFVTFVSNFLANHSQDSGDAQERLKSIGWMAEHGVMNHIIVFDKRYLESFEVTNDTHLISCFLMESGQPPDVDYTFLHLTLQEFFAALVHFLDYDHGKLQNTLDKAESYKDGRAEIFLRFLCGLSDKSTRYMLTSHLGELSSRASKDVIIWLQKKIMKQQKPNKSIKGKAELLHVFHCLRESRNTALVSQSIGPNKEIDISDVPLTPLDCFVLCFILQSCTEIEEVNLNSCNIRSEGLKKILPALSTIKNLSLSDNNLTHSSCPHLVSVIENNQILRRLVLSGNKLEGPYLQDLMTALTTSQIEELELKYNDLKDNSCSYLALGIRDNQTLRRLVLNSNSVEGPHLQDLMVALTTSRIEELELENNELTDSSCTHLALGIRENQTLKKLVLSSNKVEGPHLRDLMVALPTSHIEELHLNDNQLTDGSCPHLALGIKENRTLKRLILSDNNLNGPHLQDLMEALPTSQIEDLHLDVNSLSHSSCSHLASGIRNNLTLRKLYLSDNDLEGPGLGEMMAALTTSQIEELKLDVNSLSNASCIHLASGIRDNLTLRKLNLLQNDLEGPHLREMMAALTTSRIEELNLSNNDLADSSCPYLALGIRENQTLRTLILSRNNLEGPHLTDLMEALTTSRIEELDLSNNELADDSCTRLALGLRENQILRKLSLSGNRLKGDKFQELEAALMGCGLEELRTVSLKYQKTKEAPAKIEER
ncbi:NACHT, LRR and PYD domains-containing protein 3-like [Lithobates pipiens]